jgi:hypothetical protein
MRDETTPSDEEKQRRKMGAISSVPHRPVVALLGHARGFLKRVDE